MYMHKRQFCILYDSFSGLKRWKLNKSIIFLNMRSVLLPKSVKVKHNNIREC